MMTRRSVVSALSLGLFLLAGVAKAEVLVLYSDAGVAGDNVAACANSPVCAWSYFNSATFDGSSTNISPTPEGVKSFRTTSIFGYAGWGIFYDTSVAHPGGLNLSRFAGGQIRFWIYVNGSLPPAGIKCEIEKVGGGKVTYPLTITTANQWVPMVVDIPAGSTDFSALYSPFEITSNSAAEFYVDYVRYVTPGTLDHVRISPPSPVAMPPGGKRTFTVKGYDAQGGELDIFPTWSLSGSVGTLNTAQGPTVTVTAQSGNGSGTLIATSSSPNGPINDGVTIDVGPLTFSQTYNVYSDAGAGGTIGVSAGTVAASTITITELSGDSIGGTTHYMQASYQLVNSPGLSDAFAVWYVNDPSGALFMQPFASGYLRFAVRTTVDLQVSVRSANIPAGLERSKFRLSSRGVLLDGTWRLVSIPLSDFAQAEPLLDFSQIASFFTVGVLTGQTIPGPGSFDIADVKWVTNSTAIPDSSKVYAGLKGKQSATTGLLLSLDNDSTAKAFTYDQALAAMTFTFRKDFPLAKNVLDAYLGMYGGGAGFNGFADTYNRNTLGVMAGSRTVGPNAWMLLALIQYRNVTGYAGYDAMINGLAAWLLNLQDSADGGVRFGYNTSGTLQTNKSTEHNLDCYAAFNAYATMSGNATYRTAATNVSNWLATKVWDPALGRFDVGLNPAGQRDTDKALDIYSWAPLAMSSYTAVLAVAQTDFRNTQTSDLTGLTVDGFDFGGAFGNAATYKDAVWLEGTAQMVAAYAWVNDTLNATYFTNQLNRAMFPTSISTQGLPYAANPGTAFGGIAMDSLNPAVSSMAWYIFAVDRFNPFQSYSPVRFALRNVSNNAVANTITWGSVVAASTWTVADQYLEVLTVPDAAAWGLEIYTDNKAPDANPAFVTNISTGLPGSNPAGLVDVRNPSSTLPLAWSIRSTGGAPPSPGDPNSNSDWVYFQDRNTPAIPLEGVSAFSDGTAGVTVKNEFGAQLSQGSYFPVLNGPNAIYLEGNFGKALGGTTYKTSTLRLEYYYP